MVVVVRRDKDFLMVRMPDERVSDVGAWGLPAGDVMPGEGLVQAARRIVERQAGIDISVEGVFRLEHVLWKGSTGPCMDFRYLLRAVQADQKTPKVTADAYSLEADFFPLPRIKKMPLLKSDSLIEVLEEARDLPMLPAASIRTVWL
jgi:ADP-ribose pyrophosphatase YjhB (NUDIX family)